MSTPTLLGHQRELVHEADAGREHSVGSVLRELRASGVHHDQAVAVARERRIQRAHQQDCVFVLRSDDDPIGSHEILDRRPFLQELGVRHDRVRDRHVAPCKLLARWRALTMSAVPTGTVLLSTTTLWSVMKRPMLRAAATT